MKPSSGHQVSVGAARLYSASGLLLVVVLAMTLNERAAAAAAATAAAASSKGAQHDNLALASNQREQRAAQLTPLAKRETITQRQTTTNEHQVSVSGAGKAHDLSMGQSIANAKVQTEAQDMQPAAAGHYAGHKGHGKYYMYAESPKKGAYKAGFKRGNHKHMIMRKEAQHKSHAHGYMKWHDKKGKGSHKWEYKHHKGKHHY